MRTVNFLLITLLLTMLFNNPYPQLRATGEVIPFDAYHDIPESGILYPRLASPYFVIWGDSISIYLVPRSGDASLDGWSAKLIDKFTGDSFPLKVGEASWIEDTRSSAKITKFIKLDISIPPGIDRGLYDLEVKRLSSYREANSIYVFGEKYPDVISVAHISDNHLGPWHKPKYMKENKFFLRSLYTIESLGVDLIINTGDFIDGVLDENFHREISQLLSTLSVPFIVSTGNTDVYVMDNNRWYWERYFAPNSGVIFIGNILILSVNARNGELPDETILWIESILAAYSEKSIKIFLWHYPPYDPTSTSKRVIDKLIYWGEKYGLNLILHGHIHIDKIVEPPEFPILTVASTSTASSKYYRGFRLLNLYLDGRVKYSDKSLNLYENYIETIQKNDYSSGAQTIIVNLPGYEGQEFRFYVRLRDEGIAATVSSGSKIAEYIGELGKTIIISFKGGKQLIKVYQQEDTIPPTADPRISFTENELEIRPRASDIGLGVKEVKIYYSEDNETWIEFTPTVDDEVAFYIMKTPKVNTLYYRIIVVDYAGLTAEIYGSVELGLGAQPEAPKAPIPTYLILTIIIVIILSASIMLWRRIR